jgi:hypothetical protein
MKELFKPLCQWCMRYDCKEKGGIREQCPIDRNEGPDEITYKATVEFQKCSTCDHKSICEKIPEHKQSCIKQNFRFHFVRNGELPEPG